MKLRNVGILIVKEMVQGPKSFMFILALVVPVVFTLLVSLIFGTFFSGKARLGIFDEGSSQMTGLAQANAALSVSVYDSKNELEDEMRRGSVDVGLALPQEFDRQVLANELARIQVYVWGESQMQNRIILSAAVVHGIRQVAGQEVPVEIIQTVLGEGVNIPWEKRLLPLMVLITILMGGTLIPSTSLVMEKMKHTLPALAVTPATMLEIFTAKGIVGAIVSLMTGLLILLLNRGFGSQPLLLVGILVLGSIFSAQIGIMLGSMVKDINTLFATIKSLGIFLYAPGFVYIFPDLPQWIGRIFPTYYIIQPVLEVSQNNAGLAEVAPELGILIGLILLSSVLLAALAQRQTEVMAAV